jgi:hypothetical protein
MKITYNVTGQDRKRLVGAISKELNAPMNYLGAPTFAYEVGGYHIDKVGTVTGEDNRQLVSDLCGLHGFRAVSEEYDAPLPEAEEDGKPDRLIIEMPLAGFSETALDNLEKLVISKTTLIKKALGAEELPIERTETTLRFPWFRFKPEADRAKAYALFIGALCAAAKEQKRVTAKEKPVDNEKYAFRCFLLRLGFIGEEYQAARKILLAGLSGNGSFKSGERKRQDAQEAAPVADSGEESSEMDIGIATEIIAGRAVTTEEVAS